MKQYLFITIDTEEDVWGGFETRNPPVDNIKNIPLLQEVFDKYEATPTYLINYPVASNEDSITILKQLYAQGQCDIGTHCHPWNTPPVTEEPNEFNSFMCNLPEDLIHAKMVHLHETIVDNFALTPIVFRAGRWGFGKNVARILHRLGYRIDTSMTPFRDWANLSGPTFGLLKNTTYGSHEMESLCSRAEHCSSCSNSNSCILEIPPTMGFLQNNFELCNRCRTMLTKGPFPRMRILGLLDKLSILNYRWLSPETSNCDEMILLTKNIIRNGHRFITMSFHSTSLLPGNSPYVKDRKDLNSFLSRIDKYLSFISKEQIPCIGMSRALELLS